MLQTEQIILTEDAVEWVVRRGKAVCATDFIGYLFDFGLLYRSLRKIGGAVNVFGNFMLYSLDKKHPSLANKRAVRIYKKLIKAGFLKLPDDEPFIEFCGKNVPIDCEKANFIEQPIFLSIAKNDTKPGINNGIFFEENSSEQETCN